MTYSAPIDDIRFALQHVVADDSWYGEDALIDQILHEANRFAVKRLLPLDRAGDIAGAVLEGGRVRTPEGFAAAYRDWIAGGWLGTEISEELGGSGLSPLLHAPLDEIWNAANLAFHVVPILTQAALKLLMRHGTSLQKAEYVPKLLSGAWTATMGLTEAQAGSDLSLIASRAEKAGDGSFLIKGSKIFTSFGDHDWTDDILHLVLARIDGAPEGTRGISLFIVPKRLPGGKQNDVTCTGVERKLGLHASPTCVMQYGADRGAKAYLLGEPHAGLDAMFVMMNKARLACALQGVGLSERALQQAEAYARSRLQGTDAAGQTAPIGFHPDVKRMLLRMRSLTTASRALSYTAAAAMIEVSPPNAARSNAALLTPLAKVFASEAACEVAALNIQVHGGVGYVEETGAAQILRDARVIPLYEGTNGIQGIDFVQRKVVRDGGAKLNEEISRARVVARAAQTVTVLQRYGDRVSGALDNLENAAGWILQPGRSHDERLAAAAPFTALASTALAGSYLAKGLVSAHRCAGSAPSSQLSAAIHFGNTSLAAGRGMLEDILSAGHVVEYPPLLTTPSHWARGTSGVDREVTNR